MRIICGLLAAYVQISYKLVVVAFYYCGGVSGFGSETQVLEVWKLQ